MQTEEPLRLAAEVVAWGVPGALAVRNAVRLPPVRRTWLLVAATCGVIVIDKIVDLQLQALVVGKALVRALLPSLGHGAAATAVRLGILGTLCVGGCLAIWWFVRRERARGLPERLALLGLVGVVLFLGARLLPGVGPILRGGSGLAVEVTCCGLVWAGAFAAARRGTP